MTAEQLEELLRKGEEGFIGAHYTLSKLAPSLARRVLAAEKLVEALEELPLGDGTLAQLVTAYREACK